VAAAGYELTVIASVVIGVIIVPAVAFDTFAGPRRRKA
jgi:hypothetical protein